MDGPVYRMHAVILKKKSVKLQLPPLTPKNEMNQSYNDLENQVSYLHPDHPEMQLDSEQKHMPRSSHGRVLTQSRKLKAAHGGESPLNQMPAQSFSPTITKNYILCHVRRVVGKTGDDEDEDGV